MSDDEGLPESGGGGHHHPQQQQQQQQYNHHDDGSSSVRFEDLTVDDDVAIIDRVVRYSRSSIALQRLVHVKMLAETADLAGYVRTCCAVLSCRRRACCTAIFILVKISILWILCYLSDSARFYLQTHCGVHGWNRFQTEIGVCTKALSYTLLPLLTFSVRIAHIYTHAQPLGDSKSVDSQHSTTAP
jgi:hypothetical protein